MDEWANELVLRLCCVKNVIPEPKIDGRIFSIYPKTWTLSYLFMVDICLLLGDHWNWWSFKFILLTMNNFKLFLFSRFKWTDHRLILICSWNFGHLDIQSSNWYSEAIIRNHQQQRQRSKIDEAKNYAIQNENEENVQLSMIHNEIVVNSFQLGNEAITKSTKNSSFTMQTNGSFE